MKIKRIPEEIMVQVDDARFVFDKPCALDFLELDDPSVKVRIKTMAKRLKRIEGATFEDGANVPNEAFIDFPLSVIVKVVNLYAEELAKIYEVESAQKKS